MHPFARDVPEMISAWEKCVVLMLDQSQIRDDMQVLMVSARFGNRALPLLWGLIPNLILAAPCIVRSSFSVVLRLT
jgi:hypothetical protein